MCPNFSFQTLNSFPYNIPGMIGRPVATLVNGFIKAFFPPNPRRPPQILNQLVPRLPFRKEDREKELEDDEEETSSSSSMASEASAVRSVQQREGKSVQGWDAIHERHKEELCEKLGGVYCSH